MDVVLVNGPAGVGKTTVGRRLAATARNGICIHGDDLKAFIVARDPRAVGRGLSYPGGAALADVFLDAGYELVVFDVVFPSGRQVARFHEALRTVAPVHLLTLWAPLTTVTAREAARPHREPLGSLVTQSWRELFANLADLGAVVDAGRPVDDVVAEARRAVDASTGALAPRRLAA
jgi:chloramphenicol 3-O-phosphotransferase